jgi:hypothetical protein
MFNICDNLRQKSSKNSIWNYINFNISNDIWCSLYENLYNKFATSSHLVIRDLGHTIRQQQDDL